MRRAGAWPDAGRFVRQHPHGRDATAQGASLRATGWARLSAAMPCTRAPGPFPGKHKRQTGYLTRAMRVYLSRTESCAHTCAVRRPGSGRAATSGIEKNRAPARDRSRRLSAGQRRRCMSRNAGHAAPSHRTALKPLSLRERGWGEGALQRHPVLIGPVTRSDLPRGGTVQAPVHGARQSGSGWAGSPPEICARFARPHVILIVRAGSAPASEDAGYPGIPATQQRSRGRTQSLSASGTGRVAATPS